MIRTQIPKFRLPDDVIDEEFGYILDLGVEFRGGQRIDSLKALLAEGYDAIFVGSGAPRGRDLDIPGRKEAAKNIHIGIDWLSSVSFGHTTKIGKRVIVLGGGNTAMDCCRSSRRLGGEDVKVIVRSGFEEMKASPWEKEDAMHEGIPIHNYLVPKEFTHEDGKLTGMIFEKVKARVRRQGPAQAGAHRRAGPAFPLRRRAGRGRPGERVPLDRARHRHRVRRHGACRRSMRRPCSSTNPKVFFGGDAAFGPKNIIWAVAHGHDAAVSIDKLLNGEDVADRPPPVVKLMSQKMGIHEWTYDNEIALDLRYKVPLRDKEMALKDIKVEVELGFDPQLALSGGQRCLNCDVQTVFAAQLCIECDACVDICPMDCITFTANGEEAELRTRLNAPAHNLTPGPLRRRTGSRPAASWSKDEDVCLHCGLCAERCPTGAWDMQKFLLEMTYAGTVMPTANADQPRKRLRRQVRQRQRLGLGVRQRAVRARRPAHGRAGGPRNIFPSNIQGLPTWYEVRVSEAGHLGARGGVDLMVAMNPQTWDKDIAEIEPGGYLFYDSTKPLPASKFRDDITVIGVPLTEICNREYTDPRQRQLFKNIIYVGALSALLDMDVEGGREADRRAVQGQGKADRAQHERAASGPRLRARTISLPDRAAPEGERQGRQPHLHRGQRRRRWARLWRRHGVRLVSDHAVLLARRGVHRALRQAAASIRRPSRRNTPSCRPRTSSPPSAW